MSLFHFVLNGENVSVTVPDDTTLLQLLREHFGLTAAKEGCGKGECGACTVLLDGKVVDSCLLVMPQVEGHHVTTLEGIGQNGELDTIQEAFIEAGAVQCGFCTPGMILAAKAILAQNTRPSEEEIHEGISGNLCRCTGYKKITEAVKLAGNKLRGE